MMNLSLLLTCEHASNAIPDAYQSLFNAHSELLATHHGWDIGAANVCHALANTFTPEHVIYAPYSRLLIDLNRSEWHPQLFSDISTHLDQASKQALLEHYYQPYRQHIMRIIENAHQCHHTILHIAVHSFTPELNDCIRNNDIGLLYDPQRSHEKSVCSTWKHAFKILTPQYHIRMNYPYRGTSDGLTTLLRKHYPNTDYLGIELEINQKHLSPNVSMDIIKSITTTLIHCLHYFKN